MKKILVLLGSLIIGIAIYIYVMLHFNLKEVLSSFAVFSPVTLTLYLLISFVIMSVLVLRWRRLLTAYKIKIPFWRLFSYKLSSYAVSYLTSMRKVIVDARTYLLLREKEKISLSKGVSSIMFDNMIELLGDVFFAFIGFIALIIFFNISLKLKIMLLLALCISGFIVGFFFYRHLTGKYFIPTIIEFLRIDRLKTFDTIKKWAKIEENQSIKFLKIKRKEVLISFLISLFLWALMFIEYKLALKILGYNAGLNEIFIILVFISIAYMVPIPAALGVLELSQLSAFSLLGIRPSIAIALSFLVRGRDLLWSAIGLINFYGHGATILNRYLNKNDNAKHNNSGKE